MLGLLENTSQKILDAQIVKCTLHCLNCSLLGFSNVSEYVIFFISFTVTFHILLPLFQANKMVLFK